MTGRTTLQRLLLACSFFLLLQTAAVHARSEPTMVSVDRPEINLRSGAGTGHEILWVISRGYPLIVIGRQGKWLKVRDFENDEGWVYRSLTSRTPHLIVKAKSANIRSAPSTRGRVVARAEYGEVLRTVEHRSSWTKVRNADGKTGWVFRKLLWGW